MPPRNYRVSGIGVKAYHESVDDYVFPYNGLQMMAKFNFARDENISDYIYNVFRGKIDAYQPISKHISLHGSVNLGTYFDSTPNDKFDPFAIGGINGFKGYSRYEISAPHYLVYGLGINAKPLKRTHITAGFQALSYDDDELWLKDLKTQNAYYLGFGYDTGIAPLRLQFALNQRGRVHAMLSLGYDLDAFEFSRK
jgi:hypothetical protein